VGKKAVEERSGRRRKRVSVHDLSAHEAQALLVRLWKRRGKLRETIRDEIESYLKEVDPDLVAGAVQTDLELLRVEDLWDRSGPSQYGYTHPADETWTMIEEALEPSVREVDRYLELGMEEEALKCCLGVLEGIYAYGTESESEFKKWAPDDPREAFGWVHRKWEEACKDGRARARMSQELLERCPSWAPG
jgi:hypothetical protein